MTTVAVARVCDPRLSPLIERRYKNTCHYILQPLVMTDSSNVPANAGSKLKHDQVNHRAGEYARRENGVLISTKNVESCFAIVKRGHFGVYHPWSRKYLGHYLSEFDWRYNVRKLADTERAVIALMLTGGKRLMLKVPLQTQESK